MARMSWQDRASAVVSNLLLQDRRVAVFVCAGNSIVVRDHGSIRARGLMGRADCFDVVFVGVYDCVRASFDDVMADVADAVSRRRYFCVAAAKRRCAARSVGGV